MEFYNVEIEEFVLKDSWVYDPGIEVGELVLLADFYYMFDGEQLLAVVSSE